MVAGFDGEGPRVVQIVSAGRTGSTLAAMLLNAHPDIVSPGEIRGPLLLNGELRPDYRCSCGEPLFECLFWAGIGSDLAERGIEFGPGRWDMDFPIGSSGLARHLLTRSLGHDAIDELRNAIVARLPGWGPRLREIGSRNRALIEAVFARSGASVLVDATKDHVRVRLMRRHSGLDVRVIHSVRDAPAYVASMMRTNWSDLDDATGRWIRSAAHCARLRRTLPPDHWLLLRYEDLCREPGRELGRIAGWLGLEPSSEALAFREAEHHVIGNRMRFGESSEIRLDESWQERLTGEQIDTILRRTEGVRRQLGYL